MKNNVEWRTLARAMLFLGTLVYVLALSFLAIFSDQIIHVLETVTAFTEDEIREDFAQLYYYITVAFLLSGSLLLLALRLPEDVLETAPPPVRRARIVALAAAAVLVPVVSVAYTARGWLGVGGLFAEDGPSEWFTALVFFAAATAFALRARRGFGEHRFTVLICGTAAIACVFIALEEISYGQRLFGVATPDWLADANDQGEISVHNLHNVLMLNSYPVAGLALFAVMLAAAWRWQELQRAECIWGEIVDLVPDPALLPLAAVVAVVAQHPGFNELVEIFAALLLLFYVAWPQPAAEPLPERPRLAPRRGPARAT